MCGSSSGGGSPPVQPDTSSDVTGQCGSKKDDSSFSSRVAYFSKNFKPHVSCLKPRSSARDELSLSGCKTSTIKFKSGSSSTNKALQKAGLKKMKKGKKYYMGFVKVSESRAARLARYLTKRGRRLRRSAGLGSLGLGRVAEAGLIRQKRASDRKIRVLKNVKKSSSSSFKITTCNLECEPPPPRESRSGPPRESRSGPACFASDTRASTPAGLRRMDELKVSEVSAWLTQKSWTGMSSRWVTWLV